MNLSHDTCKRIVEQYADLVYRICAARLIQYDRASIEDACQTVFLKYIKSAPKFKDEEHGKAWFIRAAINCCNDIFRDGKGKAENTLNTTLKTSGYYDDYPSIYGILPEILGELPPKLRDVIYLFYVEEYSCSEIAKILKISSTAVRMRLKRGRDLLKSRFQEEFLEEGIINVQQNNQ